MKSYFKREVKRNKTNIRFGGNEGKRAPFVLGGNPPGTKGGPRSGNFPGPPKNTFCPGWSHDPGQKPCCLRSWLHPVQKVFLGGPGKFPARGPPLVPGGSTTRDKRGPFSLIPTKSFVCFWFFLLLF